MCALAACGDSKGGAGGAAVISAGSPEGVSEAAPSEPVLVGGAGDTTSDGCELHQIEQLLDNRCGDCHSVKPFQTPIDCYGDCSPQPIYISDLIDIDKVTPGDAAGSRLMIRLYEGSMPPPISGLPPPSDVEIAWLAGFIDALEPGVQPSCASSDASPP